MSAAVLLRLVLWNLADSAASLEQLRAALRDEGPAQPGLLFSAWVSDEVSDRFGVVQLWSSAGVAGSPLLERVRELIGAEPLLGEEFDVEATESIAAELQALGLAFA